MSSNQLLIESKTLFHKFNLKFLKSDSEMLSTNSTLNNFQMKSINFDLTAKPLLQSRIKLHRSFKKPNHRIDDGDNEDKPLLNLTATGLGQRAKQAPSPTKMNNIRKTNLSRTRTFSHSQMKNFDSVIDGRGLNESRQNNYPVLSNNQSDSQQRIEPDISSYLPNIPVNSNINYSITNNNKALITELKEYGRKVMPLNENSIKRIRKLLNLDCLQSNDHTSRPKLTNRPKLKTQYGMHQSTLDKFDSNDLMLSITHLKPSPMYQSIDGDKRKINGTPITKSSLSTRESESKYKDFFYFDESELNVYSQPIKIVISDKAPPSTPQPDLSESNDEPCKCLLCEKEALLKEKYKKRLLKKQQKLLKKSFEESNTSITFELSEIDKNVAENLNKNVQYSSSHPIISVTAKRFI